MDKLTPQQVKDLAVKSENRVVQIPFSDSEREKLRDDFLQNSLRLNKIKAEFQEIASGYREQIKQQSKTTSSNLTDLSRNYRESEEDVFLIDDQEKGVMMHYRVDGTPLFERPLRPDERQGNIFSITEKKNSGDN